MVNPFIQQIINQKINAITPEELIKYAQMYNIKINEQEARKIIKILQEEEKIDIYNSRQHKNIINKISERLNPTLATKANKLLQQFTNMF